MKEVNSIPGREAAPLIITDVVLMMWYTICGQPKLFQSQKQIPDILGHARKMKSRIGLLVRTRPSRNT